MCIFRLSRIPALFVLLMSGTTIAQTQFTDVSSAAGFTYSGESWGASWGDFNGDGLPDLFVTHHRDVPSLNINQGDGTFIDIAAFTIWNDPAYIGDMHGGSWADFDNDGDQDLYVSHGSRNSNQFLVNENGVLVDRTSQYDPLLPSWRGRLPVWLDFNADGLLDFLMAAENSAPLYQRSPPGGFVNKSAVAGVTCNTSQHAYLADITGDSSLELICATSKFPYRAYDTRMGTPFTDVTGVIPATGNVLDIASADFDGNLATDFFIVRGGKRLSGADLVAANTVVAQLITAGADEKSMSFSTSGDITVTLVFDRIVTNADVSIGSSAWHPSVPITKYRGEHTMVVTLSPTDPTVVGIATHNPANARIVYIGYEPSTQTWSIINSPGGDWTLLHATAVSTSTVFNVAEFGIDSGDLPTAPTLMSHTTGGFVDATSSAGLSDDILCVATAAADFDNDADVDLYTVCRDANLNIANKYFDNDGTGRFAEVAQAGGASGPLGFGVGKSENVVLSDYDADGDIDIFVTNGLAMNPQSVGGPDLLFQNLLSTANHWIELDLVGVSSNRDGIGARVLATAGGTTQLREQNGGYHRWAQHDRRLHFGLGANPLVNIVVEWPSGAVDIHNGVAANSVYQLFEGGALVPIAPGTTNPPTATISPSSISQSESKSTLMLNVGLSAPSGEIVWIDVSTSNGTAIAGLDFGALVTSLEFTPGQTSKSVSINIIADSEIETDEKFYVDIAPGSGNVVGGSRTTVTIVDDDANTSACRKPDYDKATEHAIFIWQNCNTQEWFVRVAGGGITSTVTGDVISNENFLTVTPFSIEQSDVLNYTSDPSQIVFGLDVDGVWQDGFDFELPASATVCFDVTAPAIPVLVGRGRIPVSVPFDLHTLGSCGGSNLPTPLTNWVLSSGGVSTIGNQISYSGNPTGWSNSVNSVPFSQLGFSDNYEVRWTIASDPVATTWVVGLGISESQSNWRDVDYGLRSSDGDLKVYENGTWVNSVGPLAIGDILSIRVNGNSLQYAINGTVIQNSTVIGNEDFYIDTSFKDGAITLSDFTIIAQ